MLELLYNTPVGNLRLITAGNRLVYCNWDDLDCLFKLNKIKNIYFDMPTSDDDFCVLSETVTQLNEYFSGQRVCFNLPTSVYGTTFQQKVWDGIKRIPFGQTISYAELATIIGTPTAIRGVARACGANPLAIVIGCHRILGKNNWGGYTGGLKRKLFLLDLEQRTKENFEK